MTKRVIFGGKLSSRVLRDLEDAGLEVELNVDLSRNIHVPLHHMGQEITAAETSKPGTLIVNIRRGRCTGERFVTLKSGWLDRRLASFMRMIERAGGFRALDAGVEIEVPEFDSAIVNFRDPPLALSNAIKAAAAPNAEAFMALPSQIRASLGIYKRESSRRFTRIGAPLDPAPEAL